MIKLLYKLFRKRFNAIAANDNYYSKSDLRGKGEKVFADSNGQQYWRFRNEYDDMPIARKAELNMHIMELENRLSGSELGLIIDAMNKAFNEVDKKGNPRPNIAMIGHLVTEITNRRQLLLHPDIMFNIVATLYIREDEDPCVIDIEIKEYKLNEFKKISKGVAYNFFYQAGLSKYLPYISGLEKDFEIYMRDSAQEIQALSTQIQGYISDPQL